MRTPRSGVMGAGVALITLLLSGGTDARDSALSPTGTSVEQVAGRPMAAEGPGATDRAARGPAEDGREGVDTRKGVDAPPAGDGRQTGDARPDGEGRRDQEAPQAEDARPDGEGRRDQEAPRAEDARNGEGARTGEEAPQAEDARNSGGAGTGQDARVTSADDDRRRRYRRRYRNRYPGPIPTPAEWKPPEGPTRIALQAGHWRADEAPDELSGLRDNGTRWEGIAEWEANLEIARRAGAMLEELGYVVDILPAVVPPDYRAHLFVSIHADGSGDSKASGYRVAYPRRDATGRASGIASLLDKSYGKATGLRRLPDTTRRMRNYYAFNFRRYEHALHPMTIAVIIETGFLTSDRDRGVIVDDPDRAARGIVAAITEFPVTPAPASEANPESEPAEPGS